MPTRVLSTDAARTAIVSMQRIIGDGGLGAQLNDLNTQGQQLIQPDVWDGARAVEFRGIWPDVYGKLRAAQTALEELRTRIEAINRDIMVAGGNA